MLCFVLVSKQVIVHRLAHSHLDRNTHCPQDSKMLCAI